MSYKFDQNELTKEKGLWDIYRSSRKIKSSKVQIVFIILIMILLAINAFYLEDDIGVILKDTRSWASTGFSFSITTLGFLIAGFTIFATLSRPEMMLAMMEHTNKETGLPTLKYNFFTFMNIFICYIALSLLYLLIMILGQSGGFLPNIINLSPRDLHIKECVIKVGYIIVGSGFVYLLFLLKTFIFNIYAVVMNFLRWEYNERIDLEESSDSNKG